MQAGLIPLNPQAALGVLGSPTSHSALAAAQFVKALQLSGFGERNVGASYLV